MVLATLADGLEYFGKLSFSEQVSVLVWFGIWVGLLAAYIGLFLGVVVRVKRWIQGDDS